MLNNAEAQEIARPSFTNVLIYCFALTPYSHEVLAAPFLNRSRLDFHILQLNAPPVPHALSPQITP